MKTSMPEVVKVHAEELICRFCQAKVPARLRGRYRLEFRTRGNAITLYESRPSRDPAVRQWIRTPAAQFRFEPAQRTWTVFWADRNGHWRMDDQMSPTPDVADLLRDIYVDPSAVDLPRFNR